MTVSAFSINRYVGDGTKTQFQVNFTLGYLRKSHVFCFVDGEVDGTGEAIPRVLTWITDSLVDIGDAPGLDVNLNIRRLTPKTLLMHDFNDGAVLNELNLDESNLQNIMLNHEVLDGFGLESAQEAVVAAGAAQISADDAADARDLAKLWASEVEGTEVETGKYSTLHYAAKALASQSAIEANFKFISAYNGSLTDALADIGNTRTTLIVDQEVTLTDDNTVPITLNLEKTRVGEFTGAFILTILGGMTGDKTSRWFDSSVTVVISSTSIHSINPEMFGALGGSNDDTVAIERVIASNFPLVDFSQIHKITSTITPVSNQTWKGTGSRISGIAVTSFFTVGNPSIILGEALDNFNIEDMGFVGDLTSFTNDGVDMYAVKLVACTNSSIKRCYASGVERGLIFKDGSMDCEIIHSVAEDVWDQGIGSMGTSVLPNRRISIVRNKAFTNSLSGILLSGIRTEETYDSNIKNNTAYQCSSGIRIENSCDNVVSGNHAYENQLSGLELYNNAQRNTVSANHCWDNNTANNNDIDLISTNKGNANTKVSGINVENGSNNNTIIGNVCYQTDASKVPFTSGSDEPDLGDTVTGVTSTESGKVRRIELTSGSWAGNDAEGVFHIVDITGVFNASEIIDNTTQVQSDIASTNGSTTIGTSRGFQKYGIGVNVRNLSGSTAQDSWNTIIGNQLINNDINEISDRGAYNTVSDNIKQFFSLVRN